jgi:bacterioferritin-associated ferredoxin
MFVCLCKGITEKQVISAIQDGASTVDDLSASLGIGLQCGSCAAIAENMINNHSVSPLQKEFYYQAV